MKTPLGAIVTEPVQPSEAIAFFRAKGFAPPESRFDYRDWWEGEHARGFVVAKAMQDDVLTTIRQHVDRALAEGRTLEQFRADLAPRLQELGWWGRHDRQDPVTGEIREVQLGSERRLRVIFDTNMRTARAAGRWVRIQRTKGMLPYLQYMQIQRPSKREDHAAWHLMVLPVDHGAWRLIYPPNGYFCGCIVRQLSAGAVEREGLTVTDDPPIIMRAVPNNRTGGVDEVPVGVTPGFASNPGALFLEAGEQHGRVAPPGMTLPARAAERAMAIEARMRAIRTGQPQLGAYDARTGAGLDWAVPDGGVLAPGPRLDAALDAADRRVVLVLGRPVAEGPQAEPLAALMTRRGLSAVLTVAVDGSLYRAGWARAANAALVDRAFALAEAAIAEAAAAAGLDGASAARLVGEAAGRALAARGLLAWRSALAGGTELAMQRLGRERFEAAVRSVAEGLPAA